MAVVDCPSASVATQVTTVFPSGKTFPDAGEQLGRMSPGTTADVVGASAAFVERHRMASAMLLAPL